jgi:hypothetical protein
MHPLNASRQDRPRLEGEARRETDPTTLTAVAAAYDAGGWPAQADGEPDRTSWHRRPIARSVFRFLAALWGGCSGREHALGRRMLEDAGEQVA